MNDFQGDCSLDGMNCTNAQTEHFQIHAKEHELMEPSKGCSQENMTATNTFT